jgi:hypothetical protein
MLVKDCVFEIFKRPNAKFAKTIYQARFNERSERREVMSTPKSRRRILSTPGGI